MKQMFDKRELALSSTSDEGLRIKKYGFKDLSKLLIDGKLHVDESIDVLNLRLLEEEKGEITQFEVVLENRSTIVNLYAYGNVANVIIGYVVDNVTPNDYYALNGFTNYYNTIINGASSIDGFSITFKLDNLSSIQGGNLFIRINPKIVKFENAEKIPYDSYLYDVSCYTQNEL